MKYTIHVYKQNGSGIERDRDMLNHVIQKIKLKLSYLSCNPSSKQNIIIINLGYDTEVFLIINQNIIKSLLRVESETTRFFHFFKERMAEHF